MTKTVRIEALRPPWPGLRECVYHEVLGDRVVARTMPAVPPQPERMLHCEVTGPTDHPEWDKVVAAVGHMLSGDAQFAVLPRDFTLRSVEG